MLLCVDSNPTNPTNNNVILLSRYMEFIYFKYVVRDLEPNIIYKYEMMIFTDTVTMVYLVDREPDICIYEIPGL